MLAERALPFLERSLAVMAQAGRRVRMPTVDDLTPLLPMVTERLPRLDAIGPMLDFVFIDDLDIDPALLVPRRWDVGTTVTGLTEVRRLIETAGRDRFDGDDLEPPMRTLCEGRGWKVGDLFMAVRVAVTGRTATPPLFDVMAAIGYDTTLARLGAAHDLLTGGKREDR